MIAASRSSTSSKSKSRVDMTSKSCCGNIQKCIAFEFMSPAAFSPPIDRHSVHVLRARCADYNQLCMLHTGGYSKRRSPIYNTLLPPIISHSSITVIRPVPRWGCRSSMIWTASFRHQDPKTDLRHSHALPLESARQQPHDLRLRAQYKTFSEELFRFSSTPTSSTFPKL